MLLSVARSTIYYQQKTIENNDAIVMNEIRDIYQAQPSYGYRRIQIELWKLGFFINHKRVYRLLRNAGIEAVYPGKKTTIRNIDHKVYPYLLKRLNIAYPNQVWQVDITYIKIRTGFVYLTCLIDVFSRKIMGWSLSTFLDTQSCLRALMMALKNDKPEIINSDQGCQFTSFAWIEELVKNNVTVSMDGKGRWADNVFIERLWRSLKYELIYLHSFDTVEQAETSVSHYIKHYNTSRPHQSLNYHTPYEIHLLDSIPTKRALLSKLLHQSTFIKRKVSIMSTQ